MVNYNLLHNFNFVIVLFLKRSFNPQKSQEASFFKRAIYILFYEFWFFLCPVRFSYRHMYIFKHKSNLIWPSMTLQVILHLMKDLRFHNVSINRFFLSKSRTYTGVLESLSLFSKILNNLRSWKWGISTKVCGNAIPIIRDF